MLGSLRHSRRSLRNLFRNQVTGPLRGARGARHQKLHTRTILTVPISKQLADVMRPQYTRNWLMWCTLSIRTTSNMAHVLTLPSPDLASRVTKRYSTTTTTVNMGASNTKFASEADLSKDLTGQIVVVTGGNSGIGKSTCMQLSKQGATVIVGCRRLKAGEEAAEECNAQTECQGGGKGSAKAMVLDIADHNSVKAFAETFSKNYAKLDLLVNNAGIMNVPTRKLTADGNESQFGTNHIGHFSLTGLLLPSLNKSSAPRVVCLSSEYHNIAQGKKGVIDFEDVNFTTRPYDGWTAYAQSKLANLLFAQELAKRHPNIISVSAHPGFVESNLLKLPAPALALMTPALRYGMKMIPPWDGVQTSLHCCLSDELENGRYYSQVESPRGTVGGWPTEKEHMNENVTEENARKLWEMSVEMTKVDY